MSFKQRAGKVTVTKQAVLDGVEMADSELTKFDESVSGQPIKPLFIPIAKVDEEKRQVWGYAALEQPDHSDEIMDYESSKPYWKEWSESAQKRSGGRSLGNMREMHKPIAAGRAIAFDLDDANKAVWIGSEVVDDDTWRKVQTGVLTGFSVGGNYVKRWRDTNPNLTRYTAKPGEVSYVDAPCIPGATFQVVKMDGAVENREFVPGNTGELLKVSLEDEEVITESVTELVKTEPGDSTVYADYSFGSVTVGTVNSIVYIDSAELHKTDLPESPEPSGSIEAEPEAVQTLPAQDLPMQVSPGSIPDGETLSGRHLGVEDISAAVRDAFEQSGITSAIQKLLEDVALLKSVQANANQAEQREKRVIKVRR